MLRPRRARRVAALVAAAALAILAAGCGGDDGPDASAVLDDTTSSIDSASSGALSLRYVVFGNDPDSGTTRRVGFEIVSRFDLATGSRLPVATIAYLSLHGEEESEWSFGTTGDLAYLERDGLSYAAPPGLETQIAAMASAVRSLAGVESWVRDPKATDDVNAVTVHGAVEPLPLLRDVLALGAQVEPTNSLPDPGTIADDVLAASVREGEYELQTLKADGSLGHLLVEAVLDPAPYPEMQMLLGGASSLRLEVEVSTGPLDAPLTVAPPADLRPWEALPPDAA